ncbi:hypothetical protein LCGC14_1024150 [marine sediment metagenome]|uniref:Uncharacterized protein n=1 Tax=marine sediment metagenome TaxID=412755 RepID=A0A0F9R2C4_9ZZZZ
MGTSKAIVSEAIECTDCDLRMPGTIRLTLSGFSDDCTCYAHAGSYKKHYGTAAAVNSNTYDLLWDGRGGAVCQWDLTDTPGGSLGEWEQWSDNTCSENPPDGTLVDSDTMTSLIFQIWFDLTQVIIYLRLTGGKGPYYLFRATVSITSGECGEVDGNTSTNNDASYNSCSDARAMYAMCGNSGSVKVDFIY